MGKQIVTIIQLVCNFVVRGFISCWTLWSSFSYALFYFFKKGLEIFEILRS
jgi:hypothetical protein